MTKKQYGIVSRADGTLVWTLTFQTMGRAKLSVQNNNFSVKNVGVAEVVDGKAVGDIYVKEGAEWVVAAKTERLVYYDAFFDGMGEYELELMLGKSAQEIHERIVRASERREEVYAIVYGEKAASTT
jgi:hypothetical protein